MGQETPTCSDFPLRLFKSLSVLEKYGYRSAEGYNV
ncbi:MAG: hypothetical protein K0Q77_1643 [Anaerosporomusa subterranea]|jgi:hypothetical protein|nr:hypothetical protein [Anaerosporomusa subterranea]